MTKQVSFSKHENKVLPGFRQRLNNAESTEDVKKFFTYTVIELFDNIFEGDIKTNFEEVDLRPDKKNSYLLKKSLLEKEGFKAVWDNSDIQRILTNLAETSVNRYRHLETNPEKTKSKIKQSQKQNQR